MFLDNKKRIPLKNPYRLLEIYCNKENIGKSQIRKEVGM